MGDRSSLLLCIISPAEIFLLCFWQSRTILPKVGVFCPTSTACLPIGSSASMAKQLQIEGYPALAPGEKSDLLHSVQRPLLLLSLVAYPPQALTPLHVTHSL